METKHLISKDGYTYTREADKLSLAVQDKLNCIVEELLEEGYPIIEVFHVFRHAMERCEMTAMFSISEKRYKEKG
jgi:hypothetical protein